MKGHDNFIVTWIGAPLVLATFALETGINALFGYRIGSFPLALGSVAVAVFGAISAIYFRDARGDDLVAWAKRFGFAVSFLGCLAYSQWAGWSVMSTQLADGTIRNQMAADTGEVARERLTALREERKKIGTTRSVAAVQADVTLECEKKSKAYPDGIGPKCTGFRVEIEQAKRAAAIDAELPKAVTKASSAPLIAGGDTHIKFVAERFDLEPATVRNVFVMFFVALMGFIANFGPAMLGIGGSPGGPPNAGSLPRGGYGGGGGGGTPLRPFDSADSMRETLQAMLGLPPAPAMLALPAPGGGSAYGSPINIHFTPASAEGGVQRPQIAANDTVAAPNGVVSASVRQAAKAPPRDDIAAIDADAPPADRSRITRDLAPEEREAADVILKFRAACIVDSPGGIVDAEALYRRYAAWAGNRALSTAAFRSLLAAATGLDASDIGGLPHYRGVALRVGRKLEAVA